MHMKQACESTVGELMNDDESWRRGDLATIGSTAARRMQERHPDFPAILTQKLGNWYTHQWK
jgi:hypothetical protein